METKSFLSAITQIAEEKGIPFEKVIESLEQALAAAYKKDYGKKGQIIKAKFNPKTGQLQFWQVKLVVDKSLIYSEKELEKMKKMGKEKKEIEEEFVATEPTTEEDKVRFNLEKHIMIEEAEKIQPGIKTGEELVIELKPKEDYGRIAAQTAKQVILQKIREAERESVLSEYASKQDQIVSGIVQRVEPRNVFLDIGKAQGILPKDEQVPGEFYRPGQRLKVYVLKVEETAKGPLILLSRAYPKFVSKLFELEVPEVAEGQVEIKSIAREPGSRTKIAVSSKAEGVDPIGSMVGQRGTRVMAVINELGGEKIDIIEYSDSPEKYIANAISLAKVSEVKIMPKNKALVIVSEDQLSLAIGRNGQNVRLAAKLTGWKIDVRSVQEKAADFVEPRSPRFAGEAGPKGQEEKSEGKVKEEKSGNKKKS